MIIELIGKQTNETKALDTYKKLQISQMTIGQMTTRRKTIG